MTGNSGLFDSNIIIYLSKREIPLSIVDQFDEIFISVITYMEILGYNFSDPEEEIIADHPHLTREDIFAAHESKN